MILMGVLTLQLAPAGGVEFNRSFAPQADLVRQYEEPARQQICLNGAWHFQGNQDKMVSSKMAPQPGAWLATHLWTHYLYTGGSNQLDFTK
ncbi:MAG: hypothetical protein JWR19_3708 [Pedosphaera sp.]|nr:hypothetical protein [Pedosphaera sp.]